MEIQKSQLITLAVLLVLIGGILSVVSHKKDTVSLKYGGDTNISKSECINTKRSSFITMACYEQADEHLVIGLNDINYEYCGLPVDLWDNFKNANSLGKYYNANIKGRYACN